MFVITENIMKLPVYTAVWNQMDGTKRYKIRRIIILSAFTRNIVQLYVVLLAVQRTFHTWM